MRDSECDCHRKGKRQMSITLYEEVDYQRICYVARYYNANYYACAIVAVASYHEGELFDWAAYMGGCPADLPQLDGTTHVAQHGDKISREDAAHFFPDLPIERYRG